MRKSARRPKISSLNSSLIRPDLDQNHNGDHEADEAHERQTPEFPHLNPEDAFDLRTGTYDYTRNR